MKGIETIRKIIRNGKQYTEQGNSEQERAQKEQEQEERKGANRQQTPPVNQELIDYVIIVFYI